MYITRAHKYFIGRKINSKAKISKICHQKTEILIWSSWSRHFCDPIHRKKNSTLISSMNKSSNVSHDTYLHVQSGNGTMFKERSSYINVSTIFYCHSHIPLICSITSCASMFFHDRSQKKKVYFMVLFTLICVLMYSRQFRNSSHLKLKKQMKNKIFKFIMSFRKFYEL